LFQEKIPSLDELKSIRAEAASATSVEALRRCFEQLKALKQAYGDDFDAAIEIASVQHQIIERGRVLREQPRETSAPERTNPAPPQTVDTAAEAAEIPPEVERLDAKSWQRAIYIGLFFTVIICAAFFYLIQTARRLNIPQNNSTAATNTTPPSAQKEPAPQPVAAPPPEKPAVRLYTDLVPGTVAVDNGAPEDLKDGELTLDHMEPGQHSMKVAGRNGVAEFAYQVQDSGVPSVAGVPKASNAMAVMVETADGKARLVTNIENADVMLDGKPVGQAGPDGLTIPDLEKTDHLLQVTEGKDRQRFVLTYASAPTLTVYVKSDPNVGVVVVMTRQDGVEVYIDDKLYRRQTETGQLRIPLMAGDYTIRVHKQGFIDPPPATVSVKKAEETALSFKLDPAPQIATLQVKGALPGTMIYIDKDFVAATGADGIATVQNVKPGDHIIELRRDQALPKRFDRTFRNGDLLVLSGPDVTLERAVVDTSTPAPPPAPVVNTAQNTATQQTNSMQMDGQQVRKGGGFVAYHVPRVAGHYSFSGQARLGGFLKHGKLQWYAGYQDIDNYILFSVDGKHASVREVINGKTKEVSRIPFEADSNTWVQVDLSVRPNAIDARVRTPDGTWSDLGIVPSDGRDFTQGKVGFYIPDKDEIAVSNFRFAAR
jgi:hypothetical protein